MNKIIFSSVFVLLQTFAYALGPEPSEILALSYREIALNQDRAWTKQTVAGEAFYFIAGFAPGLNIKIRSEKSGHAQSFLTKELEGEKDVYFDGLAYRLVYGNGTIRMYLPYWEEETAYLNIDDLIALANNLSIRALLYSDDYGVLIENFGDTRHIVLLKNNGSSGFAVHNLELF